VNQQTIHVRVCLAALETQRLLFVPHYNTDAGPIQWNIPGGRVEFGESLREAGLREFTEETGLTAEIIDLLDVSEVILPERPWHSITISFLGKVTGGTLRDEIHPVYGSKTPRWLSLEELQGMPYHPPQVVRKALSGMY
jgi:ADP-ribose pyrophosphatase YjhB (NUDIX family)